MQLSGVYVPLITPFTADGGIDLDGVEKLAIDVLDAGAAGLVALGTTGEPATLTAAERREVVDICTRVCRTRSKTLIVGAGASGTAAAVESLRDLPAQADAALVTAPSYVRPGEAGTIAHFTALAAASPVPLVVYNVPYRTGQPMGVGTLRALATLPGVVGVKHCAGGIDADTVALLADPPFDVLAGDDVFLSPMLALGAAGGVLASAHVHTEAFVALADAWRAGDVARAR
ncbi:MAG: 4-hydroxy-tetrahydrodipicolinate synthase, partial [Hamadaea sp.]|nr:4-hydroxy-tetrahydrodipicolinate synthase [Hamadaea sp.]